jgi:heptosyltransferase-2
VTYRMASKFFTDLREHDGKRLVVQTWLDMLGAIGVKGGSLEKEVSPVSWAESLVDPLLGGASPPLMGIAVSSGNKLKELTLETMSAIVRGLLESGEGTVLLIGGPMDRSKAAAILGSTGGGGRVIDVTGKLRLSELPALLRRLSVFVGVDTGIIYMADALSVPIVHLPGPINVLEQHPIGKYVRIVHGRVPCPPYAHVYRAPYECTKEIRACIDSIDPGDVCTAARHLIEAADHGR